MHSPRPHPNKTKPVKWKVVRERGEAWAGVVLYDSKIMYHAVFTSRSAAKDFAKRAARKLQNPR